MDTVRTRITTSKETNPSQVSEEKATDIPETQPPPYVSLLSQTTSKIKDEPFLFVIAIIALIVGLVFLGGGVGPVQPRFVITIVALLAVIAIAGYYIRAGQKMVDQAKLVEAPQTGPSKVGRTQEARAKGGGKIKDALQESSNVESQIITASGKGSSAENIIQSSTNGPAKSD